MRQAYAVGIRDFGESRVQETTKQVELQDLPGITWHMIGHLQSNKAQNALQYFQWIHSVDSLKLAQRLDRLAAELPHSLNVCLQVKIVPDPHKYGWMVSDLMADLSQLSQCRHLKNSEFNDNSSFGTGGQRNSLCVPTNSRTRGANPPTEPTESDHAELSMGMSEDYKLALQAKTTMVRLGRILFGDRPGL